MSISIHPHRWDPAPDAPTRPYGVYLLHGTGEHAARYSRLANYLTSLGWPVGAHDHVGHGRSHGQRGLVSPDDILASGAIEQITAFAERTGAMPVLFGHSLGGVLATELVIDYRLPVAGLILSAPAFVPFMGPMDRVKLRVLSLVAPRLCLDLGYDPTRLTQDAEQREAALQDSLIHGYKSATLVNWLLRTGQRMIDRADRLDVPTLLLVAGADRVADPAAMHRFASKVSPAHMTVHEYPDCFHELLNETPQWRNRVTGDIEVWLEELTVR